MNAGYISPKQVTVSRETTVALTVLMWMMTMQHGDDSQDVRPAKTAMQPLSSPGR